MILHKKRLTLLLILLFLPIILFSFYYRYSDAISFFFDGPSFEEIDHYPHLLFCERLEIGMPRHEVETVLSEFGKYYYFEIGEWEKGQMVTKVEYGFNEYISLRYTFQNIFLIYDFSGPDGKLIDILRSTAWGGDPLDLPDCNE